MLWFVSWLCHVLWSVFLEKIGKKSIAGHRLNPQRRLKHDGNCLGLPCPHQDGNTIFREPGNLDLNIHLQLLLCVEGRSK